MNEDKKMTNQVRLERVEDGDDASDIFWGTEEIGVVEGTDAVIFVGAYSDSYATHLSDIAAQLSALGCQRVYVEGRFFDNRPPLKGAERLHADAAEFGKTLARHRAGLLAKSAVTKARAASGASAKAYAESNLDVYRATLTRLSKDYRPEIRYAAMGLENSPREFVAELALALLRNNAPSFDRDDFQNAVANLAILDDRLK